MSEAPDQPVVDAPIVGADAGVAAEAPATTTDQDIDTEAFDRMEAPDEPDAEAGDGETAEGETPDKPASDAEAADTFEIEVGGQKIQVPKALEPLLLFQKDYTQKTQAVAERSRELDTKAEALAAKEAQQADSLKAFRSEHLAVQNYETGIAGIDAKLAEYAKISPDDWAALRTEKPEEYEAHRAQRQLLRDTRTDYADALAKAQEDLKGKEAKLTESQTAARTEQLSKALGERDAVLAKAIPDWSEQRKAQAEEVMKSVGVTPDELKEATDARVWVVVDRLIRLADENARLKASTTQAKATETALKTQTVTPAAKPAGGGAPSRGVRDELPTAEWMSRRTAKVAAKQR